MFHGELRDQAVMGAARCYACPAATRKQTPGIGICFDGGQEYGKTVETRTQLGKFCRPSGSLQQFLQNDGCERYIFFVK